jgi:arsenate reductase (glutaredoxin)
MSKTRVFGLKNCDKCRFALRKLINIGLDAELIDVRKTPLTIEAIEEMHALFGDEVLNRRSKTYTGLSFSEKKLPKIALLQKYPALMKRPVILSILHNSIGWSDDIFKEWKTLF